MSCIDNPRSPSGNRPRPRCSILAGRINAEIILPELALDIAVVLGDRVYRQNRYQIFGVEG